MNGIHMRVFKNKATVRWADNEGVSDQDLWNTIKQMSHSPKDTGHLGGQIYLKQIDITEQKRQSGAHLIAYKANERAFFLHGFPRGFYPSTPTARELILLKKMAFELLYMRKEELELSLTHGALIEVTL